MTTITDDPDNAGQDCRAATGVLLSRSAVAVVVCALLVTTAYFFIDRPVALFVHAHRLNEWRFLICFTYIPEAFDALAPVVAVLGVVGMSRGRLARWQRVVVAAAVSVMVTAAFLSDLKGVFGRYWPETWIDDNPSLIRDDAYGFHPFHWGTAFDSFPSGHTARTLAVTSVFWIAYPRWRWAAAAVSGAVVVGLVGMNYHFVGDTVAGAFLASIIGAFCCHFFRIGPRPEEGQRLAAIASP